MLCGSKPVKGGLCLRGDLCKHERSIDGHCPVPLPCQGHEDCVKGFFCAAWADCAQREPEVCGPRPMHRDGICLPVEHCVRGLHAPMDGSCPANQRVGGTLVVREALKLNGSMEFALHHQAMNVWPMAVHKWPSLHATIGDYPGMFKPGVLPGSVRVRGEVVIEVETNSTGDFLHVHYNLRGLKANSSGGLHVHVGMSCLLHRAVGGHFWHVAGPRTDPWKDTEWTSNATGVAVGSFVVNSRYDFRQNAGRAVVVHTLDRTRIGCGILAEERVLAQLHDYGDESGEEKKRHNDVEYMGIYKAASGQLHEESHVKLSCPSVEVAVPNRAGIFVEARIHLTEFEMSMTHLECSCIRGDSEASACPRGAHVLSETSEKGQYVRRQISKMHPVLFVDEGGLPQPNDLTLYSLKETLSVPAMLVDSALGGGEGEASLGCPFIQDIGDPVSKLPTITSLRSGSKVLKLGHVTNKWCVVRVGPLGAQGCSVTAKYKFCVVGGARGVILLAEEGDHKDQTAEIFMRKGEELSDMVPALFMRYDKHLFESLSGGEHPTITVGPGIGVDPPENFEMSEGGLRVYDLESRQWYEHTDAFGSQEWMEFSPVREVLFVCTSQHKILAIDTSNPTVKMPVLGSPGGFPEPECHTAPLFRDYHTADFQQGERFFTVLVDPGEVRGNLLHFYDTTDLSSWKHLSEVHANWEHDNSGLGQVVASPDGKRLIVTWHCSTLYCGSGEQGNGERLYILDLEDVASGTPPPVLGVLDLTLSKGSFVRDVACNSDNICLASLTWDGVVAVDISNGPNRHAIVARHSAAFQGPDVPQHISWVRMASGAQKVVASQSKSGRFYVERWSLDMVNFLKGARLSECLNYDSIWALDLEGYRRPVTPLPVADPAVHATLTLSISMESLLASVRGGKIDDVERMVSVALQNALNIDGQRLVVTGAKSSSDMSSVVVSFHIVPGDGASPFTLYNMLMQQLETEGSALNTGPIAPYTTGAQLTAVGMKEDGDADADRKPPWWASKESSAKQNAEGSSDSHMLVMLIVTALCVMITVWAVAFAWRARRKAALATARANAIARQNPPGPVALMMQAHAEAPSSGYVIGRPGGDSGNTAAAAASAGPAASAYVVGTPVAPGSGAAAAEGAVAGTTLTQIDTQKLAADASSSGSGSALAPQAGQAAAAVSTGVAAAAVSAGVAAGAGDAVAAQGIPVAAEDSSEDGEDGEEAEAQGKEEAQGGASTAGGDPRADGSFYVD